MAAVKSKKNTIYQVTETTLNRRVSIQTTFAKQKYIKIRISCKLITLKQVNSSKPYVNPLGIKKPLKAHKHLRENKKKEKT